MLLAACRYNFMEPVKGVPKLALHTITFISSELVRGLGWVVGDAPRASPLAEKHRRAESWFRIEPCGRLQALAWRG